ncbi:hypothetical protein JVX93_16140 [Mycolicibacterium boenickei]|nr:hypothetical protein JVX93_16140 [Mycolicibacterium boenickei]
MIESKPVGVLAALLGAAAGTAIIYDRGMPLVAAVPLILLGIFVAIVYEGP